MDEPYYLIMNPLQIVLFHTEKKYKKITEIEERFYNKMEELKNINLQNKFFKTTSKKFLLKN
jgi:hypothetical protein